MEEKLKEILDHNEEQVFKYEKKLQEIESKINFCIEHKFEEELRIYRLKYDILNRAVCEWRKMQDDLKDMLNAWNS